VVAVGVAHPPRRRGHPCPAWPLTRDPEARPRREARLAGDRSELAALDDTAPVRRVDPTDGDAPVPALAACEAIGACARAAGAGGAGAPTADGSGRGPA
jgi:hypothetical protein